MMMSATTQQHTKNDHQSGVGGTHTTTKTPQQKRKKIENVPYHT